MSHRGGGGEQGALPRLAGAVLRGDVGGALRPGCRAGTGAAQQEAQAGRRRAPGRGSEHRATRMVIGSHGPVFCAPASSGSAGPPCAPTLDAAPIPSRAFRVKARKRLVQNTKKNSYNENRFRLAPNVDFFVQNVT